MTARRELDRFSTGHLWLTPAHLQSHGPTRSARNRGSFGLLRAPARFSKWRLLFRVIAFDVFPRKLPSRGIPGRLTRRPRTCPPVNVHPAPTGSEPDLQKV